MQVLNYYECGYISHFIRMLKVIPKEFNLNLEHRYGACELYNYRWRLSLGITEGVAIETLVENIQD